MTSPEIIDAKKEIDNIMEKFVEACDRVTSQAELEFIQKKFNRMIELLIMKYSSAEITNYIIETLNCLSAPVNEEMLS